MGSKARNSLYHSKSPMNRPLLLALTCLFTLTAYAVEIKGFSPDDSLVYKTIGDTELKLHIFYPEGHKVTDLRPGIVFFFGGGWNEGSPSQFFPQCEYLASRGMVALSAEYRVRYRNKTTPIECVKDAKSAVRWIRSNAAERGIDPDSILAAGASAGGHIAAATGTIEYFEEEGEDLSVSSRPSALVLFNPVLDVGPTGFQHERMKDYWEKISPIHSIHKNTPPTVLLLGTRDNVIPVPAAEEYKRRMEALGLRCDVYLYKDQTHGFFNYGKKYYEPTIRDMDRFLVSLGYLETLK